MDSPSPVASSAAQASFQAKAATDVRDSRRAAQAHAATSQARAASDESSTVETTDPDVAVFVNAEGAGSQGRQLDQEDSTKEGGETFAESVTIDEEGHPHIDIEA